MMSSFGNKQHGHIHNLLSLPQGTPSKKGNGKRASFCPIPAPPKTVTHDALFEIVQQISMTADPTTLLEWILLGAKEMTHADGGTLYTVTEDNRLKFEIMLNDSLNIRMGGTTGDPIRFNPLPLYLCDGEPNLHNVSCAAVLKNCTINIADAYQSTEFDFSGTRSFDKQTGYRSKSFLTIPLKTPKNEIVGVLQLINAQEVIIDETDDNNNPDKLIVPFDSESQRLVEFLATQAAFTLTNLELINAQNELFKSLVNLIATAIDDKSPYTGDHCKKVPILAMLIAEEAHKADWGIFKDFEMSDADRQELQLAALLHDCGKVTTPVHVVDKATKLETIFDRIDLIETRFEVLKRDCLVDYLNQKLNVIQSTPSSLEQRDLLHQLEADYKAQIAQYEDDYTFLKMANIGSEYMSANHQERIKKIAQYQWVNSEHQRVPFLSPEEVSNLSIPRGTLTQEERQIINRHIDLTIKMLNSLPYPKHLKRIPEFAGGHHEKMNGKGYPKGLTRNEMSIQARMMGIADIFEALTAKDRPYKKGKTLSEALNILGQMKLDGHIDPDLFDLFVDKKIYLTFASIVVDSQKNKTMLDTNQIDDVDVRKITGYVPFEDRQTQPLEKKAS